MGSQEAGRPTATVTTEAPIFIKPGATTPLRVASIGTALYVMKEDGAWTQVEFQDPQFGRRVGWIETKQIRISRPELRPMDLSVKTEASAATGKPQNPEDTRAPEQPMTGTSRGAAGSKGWIDVNFGGASSAQKSLTTAYSQDDGSGEDETYKVTYSSPTGASFDLGGGFWFTRVLGFGVAFTGTAHRDEAGLDIRIPHPRFFNAFATDAASTDYKVRRVEGGVNLSLAARFPSSNNKTAFRVFGGPTYFRLIADAVNNIIYFQQSGISSSINSVDIRSSTTEEIEKTGWGFHAGADYGYFFTKHWGVGAFGRFSRGTVTISDADVPVDGPVDVKVGGFQGGGGLRIRF